MELKEFIDSSKYQQVINQIIENSGISLFPSYPNTLMMLDKRKLDSSGLELFQLQNILDNNINQFVNFSLKKLEKFDGVKIEQSYSNNFDPDELDSEEVNRGYSKGFLVINLIEFFLLKKDKKELLEYLKKIRIPKSNKYLKDLEKIYHDLLPQKPN